MTEEEICITGLCRVDVALVFCRLHLRPREAIGVILVGLWVESFIHMQRLHWHPDPCALRHLRPIGQGQTVFVHNFTH